LPDNIFKIDYNPTLTKDGIYELWVQATDVSGNLSGVNNYKITFEVINKASITNFVNYPNPFSTSTRFVFTLTGSEIPEYFKIQIMTVTGKVIREITTQELGQIRIGKNISEYAWDGKDEFGDQLANGVYLYRVLSLLKGSAIEKRETEADKFFTKGWGKMYLMR
jgi:flagellar hook assembly protein FlgD